ncbi:hypothetical protein PJL18_04019 [Paenarthrobacter nicotinovorans]|nr:hypothetical protein [Paenarthrobacter nicotinovorans]
MAVEQVLHGHPAAGAGNGTDDIEAVRFQDLVENHQGGPAFREFAQVIALVLADSIDEHRVCVVRAEYFDPVSIAEDHRRDSQRDRGLLHGFDDGQRPRIGEHGQRQDHGVRAARPDGPGRLVGAVAEPLGSSLDLFRRRIRNAWSAVTAPP